MKQFKPVLISAIVLLIVAVSAFVVIKMFDNAGGEPPAPFVSGELEVIRIMDCDEHEVTSIEIIGKDESWCIDYKFTDDGVEAAMRNADPRLVYDEFEMTTLPTFLCTLSAIEEIGEGEDADFGFDNPRRKIRINFKDGTAKTLLIGDDLPVEDGLYVKVDGEATVYAVGETTEERIMQARKEFLSANLFPAIAKTSDLTWVEYTEAGKKTVSISLRSEADITRDSSRMGMPVSYAMTAPVNALTNPRTIDEKFFDKVIAIEGIRVVEELPRDLAKYGLKNPSKLKLKTNTGIAASILIGGKSENGGSYVMPEGVPMVIETLAPVGLEEFDYKQIMLELLFFYNSTEVKSIDYTLPTGKTHTLTIELEDYLVRGSLDGKKLEGRNAGNLFQRTICLTAAGELEGGFAYGNPDIKITANLNDGSRHTMLLYKANERQYAAEVDGKRNNFYVSVTEVDDILEAFELLEKGENIPDMF